jgi:DNA (cytosine-5)-methyltransferase 1
MRSVGFTSVEVCAGAGGQALGLERAGFEHQALVELDRDACLTLRHNGNQFGWDECVFQSDLRTWEIPGHINKVDLVAGGVPCPPFSIAGKQLGHDDERDLFPALIDIVEQLKPRAVQAENVKGLLAQRFDEYRQGVEERLSELGYAVQWRLLNACDFGVPQLRPRTVMVALKTRDEKHFEWPEPTVEKAPTVGDVLLPSMASNGWKGAKEWAKQADQIAPTLVGGSRKHGGPDLGPTRARQAWARLGVNGLGISSDLPNSDFVGSPKLTVAQAAMLQGFPADWEIQGLKTSAYRQVGNAFPPAVAHAVGGAIRAAFEAADAAAAERKSKRSARQLAVA